MPRLLSCISTVAILASSPALAQISAAEIWAEWQAASATADQELTADVSQTADGLVLENLTTRIAEDELDTAATVDRVTLTELDDGTLSVTVSEPYRVTATFPDDTGSGNITLEMLMTHEGLEILVSGGPETRTYTYAAESITLSEGSVSNDSGEPVPEIDLEIVMRDFAMTYDLIGPAGEDQRFRSSNSIGGIAGYLDMQRDDEDRHLKFTFAFGEVDSSSEGRLPDMAAFQQSDQGLPPDYDAVGTVSYEWMRLSASYDDPQETFDAAHSNEGGRLAVDLSNEAIGYEISARGMQTSVSGSSVPVPIEVSAASSELAFLLPLAASDTPSEASLRLAWRELAMGEDAWAMIDPTGQVPRNPLTVVLDAVAQVQILKDLLDPESMSASEPPAELRSLTVSELEVSFGDTSLSGTADMTFAPGQTVPQPVGRADLQLVGGNALLDQLQAAGVLGPEEVGMARGVAGMFTRPGATPDTLETVLEFGADGRITANGIPLQ